MDKDLLNNIKDVVIPVLQNVLTKQNFEGRGLSDALELEVDMNKIFRLAEKALDSQWIPIKTRPMTEEEYAFYIDRVGDAPYEDCCIYACEMPDDDEEVLITTSWGKVCEDIYHHNPDGSYFEDHEDPDDVIAWMPKPAAYKKEGEE